MASDIKHLLSCRMWLSWVLWPRVCNTLAFKVWWPGATVISRLNRGRICFQAHLCGCWHPEKTPSELRRPLAGVRPWLAPCQSQRFLAARACPLLSEGQGKRPREMWARWKPDPFRNPVSEVTSHHFCCMSLEEWECLWGAAHIVGQEIPHRREPS